jgi:2,3-bisphosphoglycerate-dependent phosphoglycerate mutase
MLKHKLVLLRHGESQWNLENRFTGWTNVGLTKTGRIEAKLSGQCLKTNNFIFDKAYTSVLKRAIQTMEICIAEMNLKDIPVKYNWRLNERHYGSLQGLNKSETSKKFGIKQVHLWRRSYDIPPPSLDINDERHPRFDEIYNKLSPSVLPSAESLKDTVKRFLPFYDKTISPAIKSGKRLLIVAHGNSLRAFIKILDNISDNKILKLNIPTGIPLVYELDSSLKPINHYFLGDEEEIIKRTKKVLNQGKP